MHNYPDELLAEVFSRLTFHDRVIATHVCRVWRKTSHENPAKLWSRFRVSDSKTRARTLRDILKRSQHPASGHWVPIDIHVELAYDYGCYALAAIAEHMHHIRSLAINQSRRFLLAYDAALKIWVAVLLSPAPLLEHLDIDFEILDAVQSLDSDDEDISMPRGRWTDLDVGNQVVTSDTAEVISHPWMVIPPEAFAGHAPRLRSLKLIGDFVMPQDCPALVNLSALSIKVGSAGESNPDRIKGLGKKTVEAISRLSTLEHLWLCVDTDLGLWSAFAQRRVKWRPLRELHIYGSRHPDNPLPLLQHFNFEHAEHVMTSMYDSWINAFETRARCAPTILEIRPNLQSPGDPPTSNSDDWRNWNLSTPNGHVWFYVQPYPSPSRLTLDYLTRNLKALSLPIAQCDKFKFPGLRFAQLERLVVVLTTAVEVSHLRDHHSPPVTEARLMHASDDLRMECPALRELQLVCYRSDPRYSPLQWTVSTTAIVKFIDRHLALSDTHFRSVHLCNVRLEMEEGVDITSSLRKRYGTVVVSSQSEPPEELVASNSFWSSTGPYAWYEDWL